MTENTTRRDFLRGAGLAGAGLAAVGLPALAAQKGEEEGQVAPAEDLMREHGLLNRILLIYEEGVRRMGGGPGLDPAVLNESARIVRHFIEDYHERLEENYLFPRFEKKRVLVDLVTVLRQQHQAGRRLTAQVLALATRSGMANEDDRRRLSDALRAFVRMYRPHEAREDTVLFPAIHRIVSPHEYAALGEAFEAKEHQLFGKEGFEGMVARVAVLEKRLGLYDLAQFTPRT